MSKSMKNLMESWSKFVNEEEQDNDPQIKGHTNLADKDAHAKAPRDYGKLVAAMKAGIRGENFTYPDNAARFEMNVAGELGYSPYYEYVRYITIAPAARIGIRPALKDHGAGDLSIQHFESPLGRVEIGGSMLMNKNTILMTGGPREVRSFLQHKDLEARIDSVAKALASFLDNDPLAFDVLVARMEGSPYLSPTYLNQDGLEKFTRPVLRKTAALIGGTKAKI